MSGRVTLYEGTIALLMSITLRCYDLPLFCLTTNNTNAEEQERKMALVNRLQLSCLW